MSLLSAALCSDGVLTVGPLVGGGDRRYNLWVHSFSFAAGI